MHAYVMQVAGNIFCWRTHLKNNRLLRKRQQQLINDHVACQQYSRACEHELAGRHSIAFC